MNVTLYKAADDVRSLLEQIDPETGELPEGYEPARGIFLHKSQAVAAFILQNEAEADMVESHAKALIAQVKTARKRGDWLRRYLQDNMAAAGISEIKSDDRTFRVKLEKDRDVSVDIFDQSQLPSDYTREIPATTEPDKVLIKKSLKDGYDVPGAKLIYKDRLTIK